MMPPASEKKSSTRRLSVIRIRSSGVSGAIPSCTRRAIFSAAASASGISSAWEA